MQNKNIFACLIIALIVLSTITILGCQDASITHTQIPANPFKSTWSLNSEDRTFSISGNSAGHAAGKRSEFQLRLDNRYSDDSWRGNYCILLIDQQGIVKEIAHEQYDIAAGLEIQKQVIVDFPENLNGPLGLCIVIPQRASIVTTLWIGDTITGNVGPWPNIHTCPQ